MRIYKYLLGIISLITLAGIVACGTGGGNASINSNGASLNSIQLYYNGAPQPNTAAKPTIANFYNWCNESCIPTTQFPLLDPITNKTVGTAYVWEKDVTFSSDHLTVCLGEFVQIKLPLGNLYLEGSAKDSCGAFLDPTLVKPISNPQAAVAIFGGKGTIVGDTLLYQNIRGTYDVKLELEVLNNILIYYDYLFYNLTLE